MVPPNKTVRRRVLQHATRRRGQGEYVNLEVQFVDRGPSRPTIASPLVARLCSSFARGWLPDRKPRGSRSRSAALAIARGVGDSWGAFGLHVARAPWGAVPLAIARGVGDSWVWSRDARQAGRVPSGCTSPERPGVPAGATGLETRQSAEHSGCLRVACRPSAPAQLVTAMSVQELHKWRRGEHVASVISGNWDALPDECAARAGSTWERAMGCPPVGELPNGKLPLTTA
jgi:hypothetical protein